VARFVEQYGLSRPDALVLGSSHALAEFYEEVVGSGAGAKPAANWTMGEYLAHLNAAGLEAGHGHVTAERLAKLVKLVADGTISTSSGKEVFAKMIEERAEPEDVVEKHGLGQISDTAALEAAVAGVVAANPAQAQQYRAGKQQVLGFFVGQVMKSTGGRANPAMVNDLLRRALDG
jgi:aspartyl-tRNA(Asn)/glutamyl-tRNA(Gln) amidotransferase subunit B